MARTRVLIADDEASILRSTALLLGTMGFDVATVAEASDIVDAARRVRPDVLLQDVRMPGLDLERLVAELRADEALARIAVVLFTASMEITDIARRVGAKACLEKPFSVDELRAALAQATA